MEPVIPEKEQGAGTKLIISIVSVPQEAPTLPDIPTLVATITQLREVAMRRDDPAKDEGQIRYYDICLEALSVNSPNAVVVQAIQDLLDKRKTVDQKA